MEYLKGQEKNIFIGKQASDFSVPPNVHTDSQAHAVSYSTGTGDPALGYNGRSVKFDHSPPSIRCFRRSDLPGLDADERVEQK